MYARVALWLVLRLFNAFYAIYECLWVLYCVLATIVGPLTWSWVFECGMKTNLLTLGLRTTSKKQ